MEISLDGTRACTRHFRAAVERGTAGTELPDSVLEGITWNNCSRFLRSRRRAAIEAGLIYDKRDLDQRINKLALCRLPSSRTRAMLLA